MVENTRMCWINNPKVRIYKRPGLFVSPYSVYLFRDATTPIKTSTFSSYKEAVMCAHLFTDNYETIGRAFQ